MQLHHLQCKLTVQTYFNKIPLPKDNPMGADVLHLSCGPQMRAFEGEFQSDNSIIIDWPMNILDLRKKKDGKLANPAHNYVFFKVWTKSDKALANEKGTAEGNFIMSTVAGAISLQRVLDMASKENNDTFSFQDVCGGTCKMQFKIQPIIDRSIQKVMIKPQKQTKEIVSKWVKEGLLKESAWERLDEINETLMEISNQVSKTLLDNNIKYRDEDGVQMFLGDNCNMTSYLGEGHLTFFTLMKDEALSSICMMKRRSIYKAVNIASNDKLIPLPVFAKWWREYVTKPYSVKQEKIHSVLMSFGQHLLTSACISPYNKHYTSDYKLAGVTKDNKRTWSQGEAFNPYKCKASLKVELTAEKVASELRYVDGTCVKLKPDYSYKGNYAGRQQNDDCDGVKDEEFELFKIALHNSNYRKPISDYIKKNEDLLDSIQGHKTLLSQLNKSFKKEWTEIVSEMYEHCLLNSDSNHLDRLYLFLAVGLMGLVYDAGLKQHQHMKKYGVPDKTQTFRGILVNPEFVTAGAPNVGGSSEGGIGGHAVCNQMATPFSPDKVCLQTNKVKNAQVGRGKNVKPSITREDGVSSRWSCNWSKSNIIEGTASTCMDDEDWRYRLPKSLGAQTNSQNTDRNDYVSSEDIYNSMLQSITFGTEAEKYLRFGNVTGTVHMKVQSQSEKTDFYNTAWVNGSAICVSPEKDGTYGGFHMLKDRQFMGYIYCGFDELEANEQTKDLPRLRKELYELQLGVIHNIDSDTSKHFTKVKPYLGKTGDQMTMEEIDSESEKILEGKMASVTKAVCFNGDREMTEKFLGLVEKEVLKRNQKRTDNFYHCYSCYDTVCLTVGFDQKLLKCEMDTLRDMQS